jgi:soluble cytochrome b562
MNDEPMPDVDELKARLQAEETDIPVEEDVEGLKGEEKGSANNVTEALRNLGQQLANTMQAAWDSSERKEIEKELREGMQQFAAEVDKAFNQAKTSPAGQRAQEEAAELKESFEKGELAPKIQSNLVQGLHWLSDELGKLADQFTTKEKAPDGEDTDSA